MHAQYFSQKPLFCTHIQLLIVHIPGWSHGSYSFLNPPLRILSRDCSVKFPVGGLLLGILVVAAVVVVGVGKLVVFKLLVAPFRLVFLRADFDCFIAVMPVVVSLHGSHNILLPSLVALLLLRAFVVVAVLVAVAILLLLLLLWLFVIVGALVCRSLGVGVES